MIEQRFQHATCTWPNGKQRRVRHSSKHGYFTPGMNLVQWVDYGSNVHFEDVPFEWLSEFGWAGASRDYNSTKVK